MATRNSSSKKAAGTRKTGQRSAKPASKAAQQEQSHEKKQMLAIILFAAGLFLSALSFIEGENFWKGLHDTFYGLFGFAAALIGPLFIYIAILATLDKPIGSIGSKVWQCLLLVLAISSSVQVFSYGKLTETGFWNCTVELFQKGILLEGGGLASALCGLPLLSLFGELGAKIIMVLLLFVMVMIFTGSTLIGLFRSAAKPVKKIEETYTQRLQNAGEQERNLPPEPAPVPKPGGRFNVDIPLDSFPPEQKPQKSRREKEEPAAKIPEPAFYLEQPAAGFSPAEEAPAFIPAEEPAQRAPAPEAGMPEISGDLPAGSFALKSLNAAEARDNLFRAADAQKHFSFDIPLQEEPDGETAIADWEDAPEDISLSQPVPEEVFTTADTVMRFRSAPAGVSSFPGEDPGLAAPTYPGAPVSRPQTTDEVIDEILRRAQLGASQPVIDPENPFPEITEPVADDVPLPQQDVVEQKLCEGIAAAEREAQEKAAAPAVRPESFGPFAAPGAPSAAVAAPPPGYPYPPVELLNEPAGQQDEEGAEELKANAQLLVDTLQSFGVQTRVIDIAKGPAVTRYELQPSAGVKISKITSLADDIALNLAAAGVRIEAPIPNKPAVGIEVPNKRVSTVSIREIIDTPEFREAKSPLTMALGRDISGRVTVADIAKMPHMLIAGATGSGKSVCINSIIISLLYKSPPDQVKFLMVDPKVVELGIYNGIPHLLVPVVTAPKKAAGALAWAVNEMLGRYKQFADNSVRDITGFNRLCKTHKDLTPMPHHVIIIDELADLMMAAPNEVEDYICRLAQMARAAGMHLIIATQRPSVDVITGVIKANIPSRIAFAVSSSVDSRTILDMGGAEKLLGRGDMLFYPVGAAKPQRVQGCFVSDQEVEQVVEFIKAGGEQEYDEAVMEEIERQAAAEKGKGKGRDTDDGGGFDEEDDMLPAAIECVIEMGMASTSMLQRKLKLGYARAARIVDQLEEKGVVGPFEGSKPRQVLITRDQWYEMKMNQE